MQLSAPIFPILLMGELISEVIDLVIERATPVIVATNLLVYLQESVRTMASGLEMHQLVKVSRFLSLQNAQVYDSMSL